MKTKRILQISCAIILILLFIFPVLYPINFTFLAADDYCRASANFGQYFDNINSWFLRHNGRYTNAFLSYLPIYDLKAYRLFLLLSIILLLITLFYFIKKIFYFFKLKTSNIEILLTTIIFFITIFNQLPSVYEFFYWLAATTVYLYSVILLLLFLMLIINLFQSNVKIWKAAIIIVLLNGNSEMLIGLSNYLLLFTLVYIFKTTNSINKKVLFLNFVGWVSTLIVIFSPGSISRQSHYSEGGNIFGSAISAILSAGMFILKGLIEFPYLILYLGFALFIFHSIRKNEKKSIKYINPLKFIIISFIGVASVFFVPYFATGYLKVNYGRIGNLIHIVTLIFLFLNLINFSFFLKSKLKYQRIIVKTDRIFPVFIMMFLFIIMFNSSNYSILLKEIGNNDFEKYAELKEKRKILIQNSNSSEISLERISGTKTLGSFDITENPHNWINSCYTQMINNLYDLNIESIVIEKKNQ